MKNLILLTAVAVMTVSVAYGQKDKSGIEYQKVRGPFVENPFRDNWFVSVGGGVDTWMRLTKVKGETFKGFDKFSYVAQVSVGKWLHPYYGIRLQFDYGNVKAGTSLPTGAYTFFKTDGTYMLDFDYVEFGGEAMLHLSNLIGGYKPARFYTAILFGGVGAARSFGTNKGTGERWENNEPALGLGLINSFRLNERFSLFAEMKAGLMHGNFSLDSGGKGRASIPSFTVGAVYKWNDRIFKNRSDIERDIVSRIK